MQKRTIMLTYRLIIARNLRMLRESQHISQERLGELAGLHRTYISAVEAGRRNITIDSMERLAIALGVDIKTLFASIEESDEISSR